MINRKNGNNVPPGNDQRQWQVFIDSLDTAQLQSLNQMICDRMDNLAAKDINMEMSRFRPGDTVSFVDKKGHHHKAIVIKHNRKTISVLGEKGNKWNVSPYLLQADADESTVSTSHPFNQPEKMRINDWIASIVSLPGAVMEEDNYFVPEALMWMDGAGFIRHMAILEPGNQESQIQHSFIEAVESPVSGVAQRPITLRTDNAAIIDALTPIYSAEIEFVSAEVPEMDDIAEEMAANFGEPNVPTYHSLGISNSLVGSFFEAAAKLYKVKPWSYVTTDTCLIGVTIKNLGVQNHVLSIIGQQGVSFGALLFNNLDDYELYTGIALAMDPEKIIDIPAHRALSFEKGTEIDSQLRKEIMENQWAVAGANAYPDFFLPVDGQISRPPETKDVKIFEALCLGLVEFFKKHRDAKNSWSTGNPLKVTKRVKTSTGNVDICFHLPVLPDGKTLETLNELEQLALIDRSEFTDAWDRHAILVKNISSAYENSPERKNVKQPFGVETLIMELGFNYTGKTIANLYPSDLEDILFDLIPRKVMVKSSDANSIIEDSIAFYQFLMREYQLNYAEECLEVLDINAVDILRNALGDSRNFGTGKSLFSEQSEIFDDSFSQGVMFDDYDTSVKIPAALTPQQKKNRKDKRKSSRKARKKNRK